MRNPGYTLHLPAMVPAVKDADEWAEARINNLIGSLSEKQPRSREVNADNIIAGRQIAESMARRMRPRMTITMDGVSYWHLIEQRKATKLETGIWLKITNDGLGWFVRDAKERPITDTKAGRIEIEMSTLPEEK